MSVPTLDARADTADRRALLRLPFAVSPLLSVALCCVTALRGLVTPAFTVATGALVGVLPAAIGDRDRRDAVVAALVVAGALYLLDHLLTPVQDEVSNALMRRVDEHVLERVMQAVSAPPGLAHLEDPVVLDRIAQALGSVTWVTAGRGVVMVAWEAANRVQALVYLVLVARFRWWLAAALVAVHTAGYFWQRRHWHEITLVLYGRTNALRRSYYLRALGLSASVAKETRVFSLGPWLVDKYRESWLGVMREVWRARTTGFRVALAVTALIGAADLLGVVTVGRTAVVGAIGLGSVVVLVQAIFAVAPIGQFGDANWEIQQAAAQLARIRAIESGVGVPGAVVGGTLPADGLPARSVRFEGVTFSYPGRADRVFDGLDLEIEAGRSLAIVGENGSGKTTLVKLLCRMYDPDAGRITVDGTDLRELDPASWQLRVAALFQDFVQFQLTAYDNIAFGSLRTAPDRAAVETAAERAGVDGLVSSLVHGWDTTLSRQFKDGADLSGGQWQRLALGRALFAVDSGAGVLVLDEPTASLDVRGEAEVYERFLDLTTGPAGTSGRAGITTIVISHRFSTVRRADRIVVLEHGRVLEDGTHDELVGLRGRYAQMYALQASRFAEGVPS